MNTNKKPKSKPITTSVPTFAIRFNTGAEELEELYPSEDEGKLSDEKYTDVVPTVVSEPSHPVKQESSPMRDYLNKFGKRSCSIDGGINETQSPNPQTSTPDPWRIFSDFKGKLTKTVEEKLSEIKSKGSDSESSPKCSQKKGRSKDNVSLSDSEDMSCSEYSVAQTNSEMSSDDEESYSDKTATESSMDYSAETMSPSEVRNRFHNYASVSFHKTDEEIQLKNINYEDIKSASIEEEIESGIEAIEAQDVVDESRFTKQTLSSEPHIPAVTYIAPTGFVDLRPRRSDSVLISDGKSRAIWSFCVFMSIFVVYMFPTYMFGFVSGLIVCFLACLIYYYFFLEDPGEEKCSNMVHYDSKQHFPILEIRAAKECQPFKKFEGWINEYPEIYNPYTYHISKTQSVFLKLESNILRISHTNSKIPKRAMWNEPQHKVPFTHHRVYNLKGADIILLPRGLTNIRIWSKKYPICVILNKEMMNLDIPLVKKHKDEESETDDSALKPVEKTKDGESSNENLDSKKDENAKTELEEFKDVDEEEDEGVIEDWDTLNFDVNNTETKLYFFTRTGRDKEDWFRRLSSASRICGQSTTKMDEANTAESKEGLETAQQVDALSSSSQQMGENPEDPGEIASDEEDYYIHYMESLGQMRKDAMQDFMNHRTLHPRFFRKKKYKQVAKSQTDDEPKDENSSNLKSDIPVENLWFNVFIGRILFDVFKNTTVINNLQIRVQKKLSTIKLPYFIEEIVMSDLSLGNVSPRFHKISEPSLDERGLWLDIDMSYEGLVSMILTTKLNLMKLKQMAGKADDGRVGSPGPEDVRSPMFHSDMEDSAESSTDDETVIVQPVSSDTPDGAVPKGKKLLRMVDKIAASKYFQQATEYKYIKRAMEGVSKTELKLTVEIKCIEGTLAMNISAPPSDRIWLGFRGNPKLLLTAKPAFGERSINFYHVTKWIEKKLLQEFQKFFVMPNMEDFVCPLMNSKLPK